MTTAIAIAVVVVSTGALLELAARLYVKQVRGLDFVYLRHEYDAYRNHRLTPNYRFQGVKHNSQGFRRDADVSLSKPAHAYRIFLMGASVAYGVGPAYPYPSFRGNNQIGNNETIDYYLERYLNRKVQGVHVEVINAAVTGYWTHHHLIYLVQRVLKFKPDMVLFLDGHADYYHVNYDQFESYYYSGKQMIDMLNDPSLSTMFYFLNEWASKSSYFIYAVKNMLNIRYQKKKADDLDQSSEGQDIVATYRRVARENFLRMVRYISLILRSEGVRAVFMLQPELVLEQHKPFTENERRLLEITLKRSLPDMHQLKPHTVELMEETTRKHGAVFLDLTNVFAGVQDEVYTDYAHLTPAGNKLLAEYAGGRLLPLILASRLNRENQRTR